MLQDNDTIFSVSAAHVQRYAFCIAIGAHLVGLWTMGNLPTKPLSTAVIMRVVLCDQHLPEVQIAATTINAASKALEPALPQSQPLAVVPKIAASAKSHRVKQRPLVRIVQTSPHRDTWSILDDTVTVTPPSIDNGTSNRSTSLDLPTETLNNPVAYRYNPPPIYPLAARRRGLEGTVMLRVMVDITGYPLRVEIKGSSGSLMLDDAALTTVRSWLFEPAHRAGQKLVATVEVPVRFRLIDP